MTSFERVMNRFAGKPVDRIPNFSLVMMFAAKLVGVSYGQYCADHQYLVDGAFRCHEQFGFDMVCAISDPMREAEGFGANVILPDEGVPYSPVMRLQKLSDIDTLKVIDPDSGRRMHDRLEAVRRMKERAGGDIPVVGWVEGALAESCDLMKMQQVFINMIDEPEAIAHLLDICTQQAILFSLAQVQAGADIIGIGDAATSLIGPSLYEQFVLPYQQKMIRTIHDAGAKVKLHICGNLTPVLELVAQTGADMIDLDYMVDMEKAARIFPGDCCICGNFDPVEIMLQGTPESVHEATCKCMALDSKNNNFVAPGCEIPRETPIENVLAMAGALKGERL